MKLKGDFFLSGKTPSVIMKFTLSVLCSGRHSLPPSSTRHLWNKLGEVGDQGVKLLFQENTPAHLTETNAEEQIVEERSYSLTLSKTIGGGGGVEDQRLYFLTVVSLLCV